MPPQIALLFCCVFVVYLLALDRKLYPRASAVLWLPTIWMLSIATRSLDVWFNVGGLDHESGGIYDPLFQAGALCCGVIILLRRNFDWSAFFRTNTALTVLLAYMLLSVAWSDSPFITFKRWTRELTAVAMALLAVSELSPRQSLECLLRRTTYILIPFSIVLVKYYPYLGVTFGRWSGEVQWIGVTLQKNGLGRLCMVCVFYLVWARMLRRRKEGVVAGKYQNLCEWLVLGMTLWLLRGPSMWAASATAIYSLCAGMITFLGLSWLRKRNIRWAPGIWVAAVAGILTFGIITPILGGSTVTGFTSAVGRDASLTGRTDIWAGLLPDVMRHPMLGYGVSSFWTPTRTIEHDIGEAHNGYLETCLGLGALGVAITCMFILSAVRKAAQLLDRDYGWASLVLCFLLMIAVHNITESSYDSFGRHLMALCLFFSVGMDPLLRQARVAQFRSPPLLRIPAA